MRLVAWKTVDATDASSIARLLKNGFTLSIAASNAVDTSVTGIIQHGSRISPPAVREAAKVKAKPRRRSRPRLKVTPEVKAEIIALRERGKAWRVIGRRFGVSGTRAWQIATNYTYTPNAKEEA